MCSSNKNTTIDTEGSELFDLKDLDDNKQDEINYLLDNKKYIHDAEKEGYKIIYPSNNQLLIDLDTKEDFERFSIVYPIFLKNFTVKNKKVTFSKSGPPKLHIVLDLDENLEVTQRVLLQAALGSDPTREIISLLRIIGGYDNPTILIEV